MVLNVLMVCNGLEVEAKKLSFEAEMTLINNGQPSSIMKQNNIGENKQYNLILIVEKKF